MSNVHPIPGDNDHEGARVDYPSAADDSPTNPLDEIKSGIKAWFDVGVTIGNKFDSMGRKFDRLARLQHNTPVDYGLGVSGVYPASGVLVLSFGSPDQGYYWEVESIVIGGTDSNVAVAGSAGVYVSGFVPPPGGTAPGGITSLADRSTALPNVAFYGRRDLVIDDQEYLFVVIFGGTPGTTYGGNMSATVSPVDAAGGKDVVTL